MMFKRDYRDMAGGGLLIVCGIVLALYSSTNYNLGTFQRLGAGMFPAGIGYGLAGLGLILLIQSFFRPGVMPEIRIWTPIFVLAGTAAFALLVGPFGLLPAILGVIIISSLAELRIRPLSLAALCGILSLMAWLIFKVALGLSVDMIRWPF